MIFLQPSALLALLPLIGALIVLYLIRSRYQRFPISSTLLWRRVPREVQAHATWRRPLWELLLLLQLLVLLAGVLALARPTLPNAPARHLAIVLDGSASMMATDVAPSRFEAARERARELIAGAGPDDKVSLVLATQTPRLLVSERHKGSLLLALDGASPGQDRSDMQSALALAASLAAVDPGQRAEVVAITDGAFDLSLAALPAATRFITIGAEGDNHGISEVAIRRNPVGGPTLPGFARLVNHGSVPAEVTLEVAADNLIVHRGSLTLPAMGQSEVAFEVPDGTVDVSLRLSPTDIFSFDNRIQTTVPISQARRVIVVSSVPELWERVFGAMPRVTVQALTPSTYITPPQDAILLLDTFLPDSLPENDLILVNPPPGVSSLPVVGEFRNTRITNFDPDDPLLQGVDLSPVRSSRGLVMQLPAWAASAADGEEGPLIIHGQWEGRRVVIFGFDPHVSNLPQLAAFPVLMANTVNWLTPGRTDETRAGLGTEANVTPRSLPPIPAVQEPEPGRLANREFWPFVVALALALLSAEWWLFARRG